MPNKWTKVFVLPVSVPQHTVIYIYWYLYLTFECFLYKHRETFGMFLTVRNIKKLEMLVRRVTKHVCAHRKLESAPIPSCAISTSLIPHSFLPSNLLLSLKIESRITASCSSFLFSDTCTMEESQTNTSCVCECAWETERGICKGGGWGWGDSGWSHPRACIIAGLCTWMCVQERQWANSWGSKPRNLMGISMNWCTEPELSFVLFLPVCLWVFRPWCETPRQKGQDWDWDWGCGCRGWGCCCCLRCLHCGCCCCPPSDWPYRRWHS